MKFRSCLVTVAGLLAVTGCAVHTVPRAAEPAVIPGAFYAAGDAPVPGQWWTVLNDPGLNDLIDRALSRNLSLQSAWDRLDQAWATAAKSGSGLWPAVTASGDAARSVSERDGSRLYTTEYSVGLSASYELDIWGRVRSGRAAAAHDASAASEDLQAAAVTLTAEIAAAWYRLIEQNGQLRILDKQTATNEDYLEIITLRFRRGQSSASEVLQQRQLVESTRGERFLVESSIRVLEHQLAVLTGDIPGSVSYDPPAEPPDLPPLPHTGIPAEWARFRPDLRALDRRIRAADRRVAAAVADLFPRLSLTARASSDASELADLFDSWAANLAANILGPLLDGGQRRAELARTRAVLNERIHAYAHGALTAVREIQDAIVEESAQSRYTESLERQLELSRAALTLILDAYTKGGVDFTRYQSALSSHQRLERSCLQAQRDRLIQRIDLYRALGGSWFTPDPGHRTQKPGIPQETPIHGEEHNE